MRPVLLTQSQARNGSHRSALAAQGIPALSWPLMRISPTANIPSLDGVEALLATSAHAIAALADLSERRDLPVLAVGDSTAAAAMAAGFANVASAAGTAEDLVALARRSPHTQILYLRGRDISVDMADAIGHDRVREAVVYSADPSGAPTGPVLTALTTGRFAAITVWSRRNAEVLSTHLAENLDWPLGDTDLVAISENAADPLVNAGFRRVHVPPRPDADGMLAKICDVAVQ